MRFATCQMKTGRGKKDFDSGETTRRGSKPARTVAPTKQSSGRAEFFALPIGGAQSHNDARARVVVFLRTVSNVEPEPLQRATTPNETQIKSQNRAR
jgi:hypothetical protein